MKIVLICNHRHRELAGLTILKEELERRLGADVSIIGSLAEIQRIYYLLYKLKPEIVFISQIQEKVTRGIARYVKRSGGVLCVLPAELTYSQSNLFWFFNKRLSYNNYLDLYFIPGERMYQDTAKYTDIDKNKLFVVGSPKIGLLVLKQRGMFLSRKKFCSQYSIPRRKKNIFIYTSFLDNPEDYVKKEEAFRGNVRAVARIYKAIQETKKVYLDNIRKLCDDFPDFNIIVKPHPLESPDAYKEIKADNYYLVAKELFNNTLESIDLAIHWNSTVATECWLGEKKTLQYVPVKKYADILSEFRYGNPVFYSYDSLRRAITKYIDQPLDKRYQDFQKKYISFWYYRVDGKSSRRIANILAQKVKRPSTLNYQPRYIKVYPLVVALEKFVGVWLSRRIISLLRRDYQWKYAADNYLFINTK